jgi:hypothetical protein
MRLSIFAVGALCLGLTLTPACSEDDDPPASGRGGSGAGGTGGGTGGSGAGGSGSGGSGADVGVETSSGVTYTKDIKPIFSVKCAGTCHGTTRIAHNLGSSYADAKKAPGNTSEAACGNVATIAECTIRRIKNGSMPGISPKCTGNPAMDVANPKCLTQAEQDLVQAWVTNGAPE